MKTALMRWPLIALLALTMACSGGHGGAGGSASPRNAAPVGVSAPAPEAHPADHILYAFDLLSAYYVDEVDVFAAVAGCLDRGAAGAVRELPATIGPATDPPSRPGRRRDGFLEGDGDAAVAGAGRRGWPGDDVRGGQGDDEGAGRRPHLLHAAGCLRALSGERDGWPGLLRRAKGRRPAGLVRV